MSFIDYWERDMLREKHGGKGEHQYLLCEVCGHTQLLTSRREVVIPRVLLIPLHQYIGHATCPRCEEVQYRSPEVFEWVVGVAFMAAQRVEDSEEDE